MCCAWRTKLSLWICVAMHAKLHDQTQLPQVTFECRSNIVAEIPIFFPCTCQLWYCTRILNANKCKAPCQQRYRPCYGKGSQGRRPTEESPGYSVQCCACTNIAINAARMLCCEKFVCEICKHWLLILPFCYYKDCVAKLNHYFSIIALFGPPISAGR